MEKILSQIKVSLINSIAIKPHVENPRLISVYAEGRTIRGQILKISVPYLIKSDLWFHILKFVSQRNLPLHYDKGKNVSLILAPIPIKSLTEVTEVLCSLIYNISKEGDCSDTWKCFHATVQIWVLILKILIFINTKFQWLMLTPSEPKLLSRICIDSPPGFWM